jgi:hypothetical protein
MQAGEPARSEALDALTALSARRLPPPRRAALVLCQARLCGGTALVAPATQRAWLRHLPQAIWELGAAHLAAVEAALAALRRCVADPSVAGEGGALLRELEPKIVANVGVVQAASSGKPGAFRAGPLLRMPDTVQVRPWQSLCILWQYCHMGRRPVSSSCDRTECVIYMFSCKALPHAGHGR